MKRRLIKLGALLLVFMLLMIGCQKRSNTIERPVNDNTSQREPISEQATENITQGGIELPTQPATENTTQGSTEEPTTEASTDTPTQGSTETQTDAPTQAPTDAPTQAPTDAPTQAPTDAPTQAPTDAPTQAPTDAPTQASTEPPTTESQTQELFDYWSDYKSKDRTYDQATLTTTEKQKFNETVDNLIKEAKKLPTKYQQELYVHDWIINYAQYDSASLDAAGGDTSKMPAYDFSAAGIFVHKTAVCQGYAVAFKYCMDLLDIDCVLIRGVAGGGGHMWNAVKLDGEWYQIDVTWDDPVTADGTPVLRYNYMNITDEKMGKDHVWNDWAYSATATKYNYYEQQENYFELSEIDAYYDYMNSQIAQYKTPIATVYCPNGDAYAQWENKTFTDTSKLQYSNVATINNFGCSYSDCYITITINVTYR